MIASPESSYWLGIVIGGAVGVLLSWLCRQFAAKDEAPVPAAALAAIARTDKRTADLLAAVDGLRAQLGLLLADSEVAAAQRRKDEEIRARLREPNANYFTIHPPVRAETHKPVARKPARKRTKE